MEDKELIELFVKCIFAVMSVILTSYIIPWLSTKVGSEKTERLCKFIQDCVRAAEQLFTAEERQAKKEYVMDLCLTKAGELGIGITEKQLDALIESAVNFIKYGTEYTKNDK